MRRTLGAWPDWEDLEIKQRRIFYTLCQLAEERGLSIIFIWRIKTDYADVEDMVIQSSGPVGNPDTCVLCGESLLDQTPMKLGEFTCDGECYYEAFVEMQQFTRFLVPTKDHPPVIVLDSKVPGSVNNVIRELAWGLGVYRRSLRRPGADSNWLGTTAHDFAVRLVGWIEKQFPPPEPIEYPGVNWVC